MGERFTTDRPNRTRRFESNPGFGLLLACLALAAISLALLPAIADAASVGSAAGTITFDADPSPETNNVTVSVVGGNYQFVDAAQALLVDGDGPGGCAVDGIQPNKVTCPGAGVVAVAGDLGSGDDHWSDDVPVAVSVLGRNGADTITGGPGPSVHTIDGNAGNDTISGGGGNDILSGSSEPDTLNGGPGNDTLDGGGSGDVINGDAGDDTLTGDGGVDTMTGGSGNDNLDGGGFDDELHTDDGEADTADCSLGTGDVIVADGLDTVSNCENETNLGVAAVQGATLLVTGSPGEANQITVSPSGAIDFAVSDPAGSQIAGPGCAAGNPIICSGAGVTLLDIKSGDQNDAIVVSKPTVAHVEAGDDADSVKTTSQADVIDGGMGSDTVDYSGRGSQVTADLNSAGGNGIAGENDNLTSVENVIGGSAGDVLTGDGNANTLTGNSGQDTLAGGAGDDTLEADDGEADQVDCGSGGETVGDQVTTEGLDTISNCENETSTGVAAIQGSTLLVTSGTGEKNQIKISQSNGNLQVTDPASSRAVGAGCTAGVPISCAAGGVTDVEVRGGDKDDSIVVTSPLPANVDGGDGADSIETTSQTDVIDGGTGSDTIDYSQRSSQVVVDLTTPAGNGVAGENDTLTGVENVNGGFAGDELTGDGAANRLAGGSGDDTLQGGGGDDALVGGRDADVMDGGGGSDTVDYASRLVDVSVNLDGSPGDDGEACPGANCEGDSVGADVENVTSGLGDDTLIGNSSANTLKSSSGDDYIEAGPGNDKLDGGGDDDRLRGGTGSDELKGGGSFAAPGLDIADYSDHAGGVTVNLSVAAPQVVSAGESDTLSQFESVWGGAGSDNLTGGVMRGGLGDDTLNGNGVADYGDHAGAVTVSLGVAGAQLVAPGESDTLPNAWGVIGGSGDDQLTGSNLGNLETFDGGPGDDTIDGQGGPDRVSYATRSEDVTVDLLAGSGGAAGEADSLANIENAAGGSGDDVLLGTDGVNTLTGGPGNDRFDGRLGGDTFEGHGASALGVGDAHGDVVDYSQRTNPVNVWLGDGPTAPQGELCPGAGCEGDKLSAIEDVIGGSGDDVLRGSFDANTITGGAGDDDIDGVDGNDTLDGGPGADSLSGGLGDRDSISYADRAAPVTVTQNGLDDDGNVDDESLTTPGKRDNVADDVEVIEGGSAGDVLRGGAANNFLNGNGGDDLLEGGAGSDTFDGGDGSDTVEYPSATGPVSASADDVDRDDGQAGEGDSIHSDVENLTGGPFADTLIGNGEQNVLEGAGGDDTLQGGAGNDTLEGGDGADSLEGQQGIDDLQGESGDDTLGGGSGPDTLGGGDGSDVADYSDRADPISADPDGVASDDGATGEGDTILGDVEGAFGGSAPDVLVGGGAGGKLFGGDGADTLIGSPGADDIRGEDGNDSLDGGLGPDAVSGGAGLDTVSYASRGAGVAVDLRSPGGDGQAGEGDDVKGDVEQVVGGVASDTLIGSGAAETLIGNLGDDTLIGEGSDDLLIGSQGNDALDGGEGNDALDGGEGNDGLSGSGGNDDLSAGSGNDALDGGAGADVMSGGDGSDTAIYSSRKTPLVLSLDGGYDDGEPGEGDNIATDIENLLGGSGGDEITGSPAFNDIKAGVGDDAIDVKDGSADRVDCGGGSDSVTADAQDELHGCENVTALGQPRVRILTKSARVKKRKIALKLRCTGSSGTCKGKLTLAKFGRKSFSIPTGKTKKVNVKGSRRNYRRLKRRLRRRGSTKLKATAKLTGAVSAKRTSRTVTVKGKKGRR